MRVRATIEIELPAHLSRADLTDGRVREWLQYNLCGGSCSGANPLAEVELTADWRSLAWDFA
jgi:hypothetical protein